jgi:hypothetical protein
MMEVKLFFFAKRCEKGIREMKTFRQRARKRRFQSFHQFTLQENKKKVGEKLEMSGKTAVKWMKISRLGDFFFSNDIETCQRKLMVLSYN